MNQSNLSLQVSKNDRFSEQQQSTSNSQDQDSPYSEYDRYDVTIFAVGTERKILSKSFVLREHAEQWAKEFDPDRSQKLFLHSWISFYESEFSRDRQELLASVIGTTRGQYFVVHGDGDCIVKNRLISPALESREQADAWRHLSLPYYPDCQVFDYESVLDGNRPDFQDTYNLLAGNHITAFAVVYGGDGEQRCLPIGDRYFTTEAQALYYQSKILSEYPACQISPQNFHFEDLRQRQKMLEHLFGHLKAEKADSAEEV